MNCLRRFFAVLEPHHYAILAVNVAVSCGAMYLGVWLALVTGGCV